MDDKEDAQALFLLTPDFEGCILKLTGNQSQSIYPGKLFATQI
jgi:hypothetical protein